MELFVIVATHHLAYWNHWHGWGKLKQASVFANQEYLLPSDGKWERLEVERAHEVFALLVNAGIQLLAHHDEGEESHSLQFLNQDFRAILTLAQEITPSCTFKTSPANPE